MLDQGNICWLQITSGQGPAECQLAVKLISDRIIKEAQEEGLNVKLVEAIVGNKAGTYLSILISIEGKNNNLFIAKWQGSVQWICTSPYRPTHKRKNWFVMVDSLIPVDANYRDLNINDVVFQTMRGSGPGGQHVNTTESVVRAIHTPTGLVVVAGEERSQHLNKKLALARLNLKLAQKRLDAVAATAQAKWLQHNLLKRGDPIKILIGMNLQEK